MKKTKLLYLFIPLLLILLTCAATPVSAADTSGTLTSGHTWTFEAASGTLTVSGNGALPDFKLSDSGSPWSALRNNIKTVIVKNGVTQLGYANFYAMPNLTHVELPGTLVSIADAAFFKSTQLQTINIPYGVLVIGESVFKNCTQLKSITLPDSVIAIGKYCFEECHKLASVTLSKSLTVIPFSAFKDCWALKSITLHEGLKTLEDRAFINCIALTAITIPQSVSTIGNYAFGSCYKLREATFLGAPSLGVGIFESNNLILELLRFCGDMPVFGNKALLDVDAECHYPQNNPTWKTAQLQSYGGTPYWIASADPAQVKLPAYGDAKTGICGPNATWTLVSGTLTISGSGIANNARWLRYAQEIKTVIVEDGITGFDNDAFYGCTNLTSVTLPDSVTALGGGFHECTSLVSITLPKNLTALYPFTFGNCTSLKEIVIPDSITKIWDRVFFGCEQLKKVTLPKNLTEIGDSAFASCYALKEMHFPATLTRIGDYAFVNCTSLTKLYFYGDPPKVSNFTFKGVTGTAYYPTGSEKWEYGGLSYHSGRITEKPDPNQPNNQCAVHSYGAWVVTLEPTVLTHGQREKVCTVCGHKVKETMPPVIPPYVQPTHPELGTPVASGNYEGGNVLWTLYPDGTLSLFGLRFMQNSSTGKFPWSVHASQVTRVIVEEGLLTVSPYAFSDMSNLTSVQFYNTLQTIGSNAFANCTKLESITIPASVTELGKGVFMGCTNLSTILFAENSALTQIHEYAFSDCGLVSIEIPGNIEEICEYAFNRCTKLERVTLAEGVKKISSNAFARCTKLTEIILPSTLETIVSNSFASSGLTKIIFKGDAPANLFYNFYNLKLAIHYPKGNPTWIAEKLQNYNGTVTWMAACQGEHSFTEWTEILSPSTEAPGLERRLCKNCQVTEERAIKQLDPPPPTQPTEPPTQPTVPSTQPTVPSTQPTEPPAQPSVPPTELTDPSTPAQTDPTAPTPSDTPVPGKAVILVCVLLVVILGGGAAWFFLRKRKA